MSSHYSDIILRKYKVSGINLNVAQTGRGEPLLLVHGWSNNWNGWTPLAEKLSPHYRLYMPDLPGFGDSSRLDKYTIAKQAKYLNAFLQQNNIKPKAVIGASLGTIIVSKLLKLHPTTSDNLILLGAVFNQLSLKKASDITMKILALTNKTTPTQRVVGKTMKSRYTAYLVEKFLNAYKFDKTRVDKYGLPGRKKMTGKSWIQLGLSASKFNLEDYIKTSDKKILLIYGEADKYVRPQKARQIISQLNNAQLHLKIINKSGHNPAYEQPGSTAKHILNFLK